MPNGPVSTELAYFLAFAAGLVATWVLLGRAVTAFFRGPDTELRLLTLPLVGGRRSNWSLRPSPGCGAGGRSGFGPEA